MRQEYNEYWLYKEGLKITLWVYALLDFVTFMMFNLIITLIIPYMLTFLLALFFG